MCLKKLEDFNVRLSKDGVGTGYKVFNRKGGRLCGEYARPGKERRVGVWLKEKNFRPQRIDTGLDRDGVKYKCGWHIFLKRNDALDWSVLGQHIRKIKFKGIVAMGRTENNRAVIVAKEIFIPKEAS